MKTTTTDTTMTTTITATTNNKSVGSRYLANYLRSVKQANEPTAVQYEYRLSRFERYIATAYKEERQEQQDQELIIITLDDVVNDLKRRTAMTTRLILTIFCLALLPTLKKRKV